jgi:GNAT superfamily N-acetyltransferase
LNLFRRLKRRLFNTKPTENSRFFLDNKARKIWYFWDGDPINDLCLSHRGRWIGRMQFIWRDDILELGDIVIFEHYPQYRNSGIGTWMFRNLVEVAREHKISRIVGRMQPESIDLWPKLRNFYMIQGCEFDGNWFIYLV